MGSFLLAAFQLTPLVVQAGEDIAQFVQWAITVYNLPSGPSDGDWDTLQEKEDMLRAKLYGAPIVSSIRAATPLDPSAGMPGQPRNQVVNAP